MKNFGKPIISDSLQKELSLTLSNEKEEEFQDYEMTQEAIDYSVKMTLEILGIGNNSSN